MKDRNFEIVSVAQDTGGVKDAGPAITDANPSFTVLIDEKHLVTKLYNMVNVPTGVWINEKGRIVRPNEVAFIDDRFKVFTGLDSAPYISALKDWIEKGDNSVYAMSEDPIRQKPTLPPPNIVLATAHFRLAPH